MTPEQERLVISYVENGGAFLNLHNSLGLYPKGGPYLKFMGGYYIGHGPLERFQVEIVDRDHPITKGVTPFFIADEQHTPLTTRTWSTCCCGTSSDDGKAVAAAGWVREPGRGRPLPPGQRAHPGVAAPSHVREADAQRRAAWCGFGKENAEQTARGRSVSRASSEGR